jgi:replicative DNA helicase
LTDLLQCVPTAASAGYYAGIVARKATLRRLVAAGTRVVSWGYTGADGDDVDKVVDAAQAEVYAVTESRRTSTDFTSITDLMQTTIDEIDAMTSGTSSVGVPTGFRDLDTLTHGLQPGQLIVIGARPGQGKSTVAMISDLLISKENNWLRRGRGRGFAPRTAGRGYAAAMSA